MGRSKDFMISLEPGRTAATITDHPASHQRPEDDLPELHVLCLPSVAGPGEAGVLAEEQVAESPVPEGVVPPILPRFRTGFPVPQFEAVVDDERVVQDGERVACHIQFTGLRTQSMF